MVFRFKQFDVKHDQSPMRVGTDALLLGAMVRAKAPLKCLEVGAGCGVISLMLAQRFPSLTIHAIELDNASYQECDYNFKASPWAGRLTSIEGDFCRFDPKNEYDLIVSNPPFYTNGLLPKGQRTASAKHNASMPFESFFQQVAELLSSKGVCWIIFSSEDVGYVEQQLQKQRMFVHEKIWVNGKPSKRNRCVLAFGKNLKTIIESEFIVRDEVGQYSDEYIKLTKDYHLINL